MNKLFKNRDDQNVFLEFDEEDDLQISSTARKQSLLPEKMCFQSLMKKMMKMMTKQKRKKKKKMSNLDIFNKKNSR